MRFIAKGHKVNAVLFDGTNLDEVKKLVSPRGVHSQEGEFFVVLHEGNLQFLAGEYIVGNGYGHINVRAKEGFERDFVPLGGYEVEKVYCVYDRDKVGKQDCLPHEGIYLTEDEAVKACISPRYFIVPVQVGIPMPAEAHESEYNWYPRLQTKEDAIRIRNEYAARVQREKEERDKPENLILPKPLYIGMFCVTHENEVVKITADEMPDYPYSSFKRLATTAEIEEWKKKS